MIFDIVRFNLFALDLLTSSSAPSTELTIGEYLEREGYSDAFRDDYLMPMTACVWSTGPDKCALEFPALTLVRFMWNHHLLSTVTERPPWLTIEGGSQRYIDAAMEECRTAKVHLSTPVETLERKDGQVELALGGQGKGSKGLFDEVVLACHGDQARWLVGSAATLDERRILSAFETSPNTAYLHSDPSVGVVYRLRGICVVTTYSSCPNAATLGLPGTTSPIHHRLPHRTALHPVPSKPSV
jgi:predicted NAD/FAD-binding protein